MARAASLADAASYAGVVGNAITATSTPTTTQATAMWDDAYGRAQMALVQASLSPTQTAGTIAYARALEIERLWTSASIIRSRQPIGPDAGPHPAAELERRAEQIAEELRLSAQVLIGAGQATALDSDALDAWSYFVDGQAPGVDLTPGVDIPYAPVNPNTKFPTW